MVGDFNQTCREKIESNPENPLPCPAPHCETFQFSREYHESCEGRAVYSPVQTVGCYNPNKPENERWFWGPPKSIRTLCKERREKEAGWELENCACCCSCFAKATPIGLPEGERVAIGDIIVGDVVLAGSPGAGKVEWAPATVAFSQGTEEGRQAAMVFIVYGEGDELITTAEQPLMLADGKLTTAARLAPGQELMGVDGDALPVQLVSIGGYQGGVHHISTDTKWVGSVDDHLIQANGVVAGDFTLQVHFPEVEGDQLTADWEALPEIGTAAYQETHTNLLRIGDTETFALADTTTDAAADSAVFSAFGTEVALPLERESFVTEAQAEDILEKGKQAPITEQVGYSMAEEAIALIRGFYPGFVYYVEWNNNEPNAYAFERYGQKIVVISGGLCRMEGIGFTALAMVTGHCVGRFLGGEPRERAYSCTGDADLFAFGVVSRKIWYGKPWISQCLAAMDQLTAQFKHISPKHAKGNPHNVCGEPSIQCREETWSSALAGGGLPECAGGPPIPPLKVEQVKATAADTVQIVFSQAPELADEGASKFAITPTGKVLAAQIDPKRNFIVELTVEGLEPGKYELICSKLESIYGGRLKPDPSSTEFEVEGE